MVVDFDLDGYLDSMDFDTEDVSDTTAVITKPKKDPNEQIDLSSYTKKVDLFSFVPKNQNILGLDISKSSTGWCHIENGKRTVGNITLTGRLVKQYPSHKELMYRVELKEELAKLFANQHFDHIMIEDVFQGANARTVRLLYDINTAIDELIYEKVIICDHFHRISNQTWKKWLYYIDTYDETKGLLDKPRIQACMSMLGVRETGEGFQDRLDSTGLVAGYFINEATKYKDTQTKANFSLSDIGVRYRATKEDALAIRNNVVKISDGPVEIGDATVSKGMFEKYVRRNPNAVWVTRNKVSLGFLGANKNMKAIAGGGYLAFWVKPTSREKYNRG